MGKWLFESAVVARFVFLSKICQNVNTEISCHWETVERTFTLLQLVPVSRTLTLMSVYCFFRSHYLTAFSTSSHMMAHLPITNSSNRTKMLQEAAYSFFFNAGKLIKVGTHGLVLMSQDIFVPSAQSRRCSKLEDLFVTMKLLLQPLGREED